MTTERTLKNTEAYKQNSGCVIFLRMVMVY